MLRTNRAAIFWKNILDYADSITATSEASASTPVENVVTYQPGQKWRSDSVDSQSITLEFENYVDMRFLGIFSHNLSTGATIRVELGNNADFSDPAFDGTFYAWPSLSGLEEMPLDMGGLGGVPIIDEFQPWQYRTALFLDLIVDFVPASISGTVIKMPRQIARISGQSERSDPSGEFYIGMPIGAPVQHYALEFVRASSQYISITAANFIGFDTGRLGFQTEIKRATTGTLQRILTGGADDSIFVEFTTANKLRVKVFTDGTDGELVTTQTFTNVDDFFTIRFDYDKNEPTERMRLYINGLQVSAFDTETQGTGDLNANTASIRLGADSSAANCLDGVLYSPAFFSGILPGIETTTDAKGRTLELVAHTALYSMPVAAAGPGAIDDYKLTGNWTRSGSIAATEEIPVNYGQVRIVDSFNKISGRLTVHEAWSFQPQAGDGMRIDATGAISVRRNDETYYGKHLRITIDDPENASGYVEIGYLAAGVYLQPKYGVVIPRETLNIDPSQRYTSYGGATWVSRRQQTRTHGFAFANLSESEVINEIEIMAQRNGSFKPVIWMPFVENSGRAYNGIAFGLLDQPPAIRQGGQNHLADVHEAQFSLTELR